MLANAAAAAFYGKCLITLPAAGVARSHIQERGMSPTTVKAFAMGYAPDGYFRVKGEWGKGSLVHHLRDLGFTPIEIIEAGLATRTNSAQRKGAPEKSSTATSHDSVKTDDDYSSLIDRFRNRLVVPIFDSRGANVLGFGARILQPEETDNSGYKAPKYINSPESPVFQKKNVLFGQHCAREAVREMRKTDTSGEVGPDRGSVVIVEGYMDAISLWEAGIHEVVASMGTALTMEQLSNAARTAGTHGGGSKIIVSACFLFITLILTITFHVYIYVCEGRIVLCFDGDEAGLNAIERLCTGSLLSKTTETYVVEILVATLPSGVKDPGEYIESRSPKNKARAGEEFRKSVINTAKDWTAWYLDRLLSRYDDAALRGTAGSFADICNRVSDFLSGFPNPAERTKRAHDVAGSLADIVSGKSDSGGGSNALRIQLETDLVNMVTRKAVARESIERRIESLEGYSPDATNQILAKMTEGDGVSASDDSSKLSSRAIRAMNKADLMRRPDSIVNVNIKGVSRRTSFDKEGGYNGRRRARIQRSSKKWVQPPLTPHFSGFDFENPSDVDWLNLPREKVRESYLLTHNDCIALRFLPFLLRILLKWKRKKSDLTLGTAMDGERYAKARAARVGEEHVSDLFLDDLVYFNSNDYHGHQFLTEDAVDAGYSNVEVARDGTIFEHGVGTLVRLDAHTLADAAEVKILRNIVKFGRARMAMIHSLATSDATGSKNQIEWNQPERAWLFERLVNQSNLIPREILSQGRIQDLRKFLAALPDAPAGAFGVDSTVSKVSASLDAKDSVDPINGEVGSADIPSPTGSNDIEAPKQVSSSYADSAIDIRNSIDEANTPSDIHDIESWAASYDPSMFDDAYSVAEFEKSEQNSSLSPIEAVPVFQEVEVINMKSEMSPGCLDIFFASEEDLFAATYDDSVSRELRAELEVQEAHATLLRASALKQLAAVKEEWLAVGRALTDRLEGHNVTVDGNQAPVEEATSTPDVFIDMNCMSIDSLKEHFATVATRLQDISETVYHLDVSAKRIGSRLMDYSNADGIEGRLSVAQQEELASMVDKHVESLPRNWKAPEMAEASSMYRSHNNRDPMLGWGDDYSLDRIESFEDDMAQISANWGEWANDDFVWSPEGQVDSVKLSNRVASTVPNVLDNFELEARLDEDDESLEDALHRLDSEWSGWDSDYVQMPRGDAKTSDLGGTGFTDGYGEIASPRDASEDESKGPKVEDCAKPEFGSVFD